MINKNKYGNLNINKCGFDNKQMKLSNEIKDTLSLLGYNNPTPIQSEVIPLAMKKENIIAGSKTGSGKTAAFAIPICERADWNDNIPGALVLEPTRELSVQVKKEIFNIGRKKKLKVADLFGGFSIDKQILTLKQKTHVAVGTPGRIMDHLRRATLDLSNIKILVIDEADLMLDMGFEEEVNSILNKVLNNDNKVQIMLFSATIGERIENIADRYMGNATKIILSEEKEEKPDIDERMYYLLGEKSENKYSAFINLMISENPDKCMIFCGTREMVNVLWQKMKRDRIRCGMLHGDMEQRDRIKTIEDFTHDRFRYLISTDVGARGIDFEGLTHVINYDFPTGRETYVHRIGRTGRNGNSGIAISFVTDMDIKMKKMVDEYMGIDHQLITEVTDVTEQQKKIFEERQKEKIKARKDKAEKLNKSITKLSIGGGRKSKMRAGDIVGALCSIDGITMDDVGIIDVRDSITYVEILNGKGMNVLETLQSKAIKGKIRKVKKTR